MSPADALAHLAEISSQIEVAVLVGAGGEVAAATPGAEAAGATLAGAALELLAAAELVRPGRPVTRVEAALQDGSLVAVREDGRVAAARTIPGAPSALVLYDLRSALRSSAPEPPKPRRRKAAGAKADA